MHRIKQKEAKARPESAGQGRARQGRAGRGQDKVGRGRVGQGGAGWSQGELRPALASPDMSLKNPNPSQCKPALLQWEEVVRTFICP